MPFREEHHFVKHRLAQSLYPRNPISHLLHPAEILDLCADAHLLCFPHYHTGRLGSATNPYSIDTLALASYRVTGKIRGLPSNKRASFD
jgi:hypothetical protein